MAESEEKLTGGNTAESVLRVGETVRKPVTRATPAVHSFLRHLHASGLLSSPQALGMDEEGRQVLEFVPGPMWNDSPRGRDDLYRVGMMIRALHTAAASFAPFDGAEWDAHSKPTGNELVCHNDLAPWNLVCAPERWVFIDWDASAPSTPLWDLAWSAISFPAFVPECNLEDVTPAMSALLDGYGLEPERYEELIGLMVTRARDECAFIVEGAEAKQQPWERLHREEHHLYWGPVADWIERNASEIRDRLNSMHEADRRCSQHFSHLSA